MRQSVYKFQNYTVKEEIKNKAVVVPSARQAKFSKTLPIAIIACLVLALTSVLVVPLLVDGGALSAGSSSVAMQPVTSVLKSNAVSVENAAEAETLLGFSPVFPAKAPEGFSLTALFVLDSRVLEAEYSNGKTALTYRMAQGNDDLSEDLTEYSFNVTETIDNVSRSYSGVSEKKLNIAVWATNNNSFAIISKSGHPVETVKALAQAI